MTRELVLAAAVFGNGEHRASQALGTLQELNNAWIALLSDAISVYRDGDGMLCMGEVYDTTPPDGATGYGLLGDLLEATCASPCQERAAGAGESGGYRRDVASVARAFVQEVEAMIRPGYSAVFALVRTVDREFVAGQFWDCGADVLSTVLPLDPRPMGGSAGHDR